MASGIRDLVIRGVRENNLKNLTIRIPKNRLVAVVGPSGSGKTTLLIDVLASEARRRTSFLNQSAGRDLRRPQFDSISGLSFVLEPGAARRYPRRATVAHLTRTMQPISRLFLRSRELSCSSCREPMKRFEAEDVARIVATIGGVVYLGASTRGNALEGPAEMLRRSEAKGFARMFVGGELLFIDDYLSTLTSSSSESRIGYLLIDSVDARVTDRHRLLESIVLAAREGDGNIAVCEKESGETTLYSLSLSCPSCGVVQCRVTEPQLLSLARTSVCSCAEDSFSADPRCRLCFGSGLFVSGAHLRIGNVHLGELLTFPLVDVCRWMESQCAVRAFDSATENITKARLEHSVCARLQHLVDLGLGHLSLSRSLRTVSRGELQRASLSTSLGNQMRGLIYICDEPALGLHPRDSEKLVRQFRNIIDRGNSLIAIEHNHVVISCADYIIELGPGAGSRGGEVTYEGPLLPRHLRPPLTESLKPKTRVPEHWLRLEGARCNNLKSIDVRIPLGMITIICGVSGSGKTSLVFGSLVPALLERLRGRTGRQALAQHRATVDIQGWEHLSAVVIADGIRSKRSKMNIAAAVGVLAPVAELLAASEAARVRGFSAKAFSKRQGGCAHCGGAGIVEIREHDQRCKYCFGSGFNRNVRGVKFRGLDISEILAQSAEEALYFFDAIAPIQRILSVLVHLGLGYLKLNQPVQTLSHGERQRLSLVPTFVRRSDSPALLVFEEPTSGLASGEIAVVQGMFSELVQRGHTVVAIEHSIQMIRSADYLIELGPGAGALGGELIASGTPHEVANYPQSVMAEYLK